MSEIESAAENAWLASESARLNLGGIQRSVWIGLRYVAGTFVWTDGTTPTYTNWFLDQPNQMGCTRIRTMSADWGDLQCTTTLDYVCEAP